MTLKPNPTRAPASLTDSVHCLCLPGVASIAFVAEGKEGVQAPQTLQNPDERQRVKGIPETQHHTTTGDNRRRHNSRGLLPTRCCRRGSASDAPPPQLSAGRVSLSDESCAPPTLFFPRPARFPSPVPHLPVARCLGNRIKQNDSRLWSEGCFVLLRCLRQRVLEHARVGQDCHHQHSHPQGSEHQPEYDVRGLRHVCQRARRLCESREQRSCGGAAR